MVNSLSDDIIRDAKITRNSLLRAAIVGCGQIAGWNDKKTLSSEVRTHAKAYWLHPATQLVAVVDKDGQRAHEFSRRWGDSRAYVDFSQMLAKEKPDIVSICTPDDMHADLLEACLEGPSVRAVWCEKPLTTDTRGAERIVSLYKEKKILLAVNYQRRWDAQMERIKSALQKGELGAVQKIVVYYTKGIYHNGSHAIDLLLDWFGPPGEMEVFARHFDFAHDDPTLDARLLLGDVPVYLIGADERNYGLFEVHILGTLGRIDIKNFGRETEWFRCQLDSFDNSRELFSSGTIYPTEFSTAMANALKEIIQAISTGQSVRSSGESALMTLRVCQALAMLERRS